MDKNYKWKVLLIIAVISFCIWKVYPPQEKINLGLDLQGGMQLLLQVELDKLPVAARADATERAVKIIRTRIDEFGVKEPVISKQGRDQIVVQLPGLTDRDRAKDIVAKTAHLEFRIVSDNTELIQKAEAGNIPEGYEYKQYKNSNGSTNSALLSKEVLLTGDHLTNASVGFGQYGDPIVQIEFDSEGAKAFDRITFQNIGKQMAIVLDGKIHSAPVIRDRIPNGHAQISGNFTNNEASDLSLVLRAGALPAPVHVVEERTVGPTLGRESIEKGIKAGIFGTILVFIFMPVYYLTAGLIANVGLIVYILMVIGSLALTGSSLTLPGIAGFILSIGMAVDANVLITERMREELQIGKTPRASISAGYHRAFSAIIDSHVTTLITSAMLFYFGTGPIKGFAVTLTFGLIASLFSSLLVTRAIFDFLTARNPNLSLKMLKFFDEPKIHFLRGRFFAYGFSVLTLIIGLSSFFIRGRQNFGVEFVGGTLMQVAYKAPTEVDIIQKALVKKGIDEPSIQRFGDLHENQFIIKTKTADVKKIEAATKDVSPDVQTLKVDQVGPAVSGDLKTKALWAVFWSSIGILIYLAFRFEWRFSIAAVVALLHDTLFTFGVYALSGREINLPIVAAILTIMGYSVTDTIVTLDRVRENMKTVRKKSFSEIVELSINQTLSRTLLTSLTVLFGAFALFFFGGPAINDFAFILCVGFLVGIYSTIFVASAVLVDLAGNKSAAAVPAAKPAAAKLAPGKKK